MMENSLEISWHQHKRNCFSYQQTFITFSETSFLLDKGEFHFHSSQICVQLIIWQFLLLLRFMALSNRHPIWDIFQSPVFAKLDSKKNAFEKRDDILYFWKLEVLHKTQAFITNTCRFI